MSWLAENTRDTHAHLAMPGRLTRTTLRWSVFVAASLGVTSGLVELTLLLFGGWHLGEAATGALATIAFAVFLSLLIAPIAIAVQATTLWLWHRGAWLRRMWLSPATLVALIWAWVVLDPSESVQSVIYTGFAFAAAGAVAVLGWLAVRQPRLQAQASASVFAAAGLAMNFWFAPLAYEELHALSLVVIAPAVLVLCAPMLGVLGRWRSQTLLVAISTAVVAGFCWLLVSNLVAPDWRVATTRSGYFFSQLSAPFARALDLDGDGHTRLWNIDCDDTDATRHPLAGDVPGGGDANCNGVDPPATPTDADRGLLPAFGVPSLPPGEVDLVLWVILDTARHDILDPELMPSLAGLAARGVTLERLYAGGTSTSASMPFLHRFFGGSETVMEALAARGVESHALVAKSMGGFGYASTELLPDSVSVTDAAIARVESTRGSQRLVLAYYFDLHQPIAEHPELSPPASRSDLPPDASYRTAAVHLDQQLGRLFDYLERSGALSHSLVLVTADHGEGLGDHGVEQHGRSGFEAITRVPGVLVGPGLRPGRYRHVLSHRDIPPTLLGAFATPGEVGKHEVFGRSLLRLRADATRPLREFAVVHSGRATSGKLSSGALGVIVGERYKLIVGLEDGLVELFDLQEDPSERESQAHDFPEVRKVMQRQLATYCDVEGWP